jgi:EmrB/QacA subfamily drug resistance transporter
LRAVGGHGYRAREVGAAAQVAGSEKLDRTTILAMIAMGVAVLVVANDFTALSVALPAIEKQFNTDVTTVQWVINAYALTFGVLIIVGGRLADVFGRRRMFVVGAAIFAGFSVIGGAAQSTAWLITCRTVMGVGGALMWPAILGMTFAALPESKAGLAGGLILGAAGIGNALGPLFGGILTDALSWRWIFFVNLPVAVFGVLVTLWAIPPDKPNTTDRSIDYGGVITLAVGLVALLVALDQVTDWGWGDTRIIILLAVFVVMLLAFGGIQRRRGERALIPPSVLGNRSFSAACLSVLLMSAIFFAALLYLPQFMQKILGYTPLESGAGLLPLMGIFAITSFIAGPLYNKLGAKLTVSLGAGAISLGILLISLITENAGYGDLVPGLVIVGIGVGLFYSSITTAAVTALDAAHAALAGGIVYMFQIAGGSVGLGLDTTIFTARSQGYVDHHVTSVTTTLTDSQVDAVHGILSGTQSARAVTAHLSAPVAHQITQLVRDAFITGLHTIFRIDAALAFAGLIVAVLFVGGRVSTDRLHELARSHHRVAASLRGLGRD